MASEKFLEDALSNDVDQSAVNAIVGSLENQLGSGSQSQAMNDPPRSSANQNIGMTSGNFQLSSSGNTIAISNLHGQTTNIQNLQVSQGQNQQMVNFQGQGLQNPQIIGSGGQMQSMNKPITMQTPLVIKQSNTGHITIPMSVDSTSGIQNVIMTKPLNQINTSQMGGNPSLMPGVQIVNVRPGATAAQKSVAAVPPRVVIGSPQVVRAGNPGITLQGLQGLQSGQQGHLLLKTENGQFQLLRVGPAPPSSVGGQPQTVRLSTVPGQNSVISVSSSVSAQPAPIVASVAAPIPQVQQANTVSSTTQPSSSALKPSDNTKEKCRNFLANLLDLSKKEPKSVEISVKSLIQKLIDAQVEPEEFCDKLERLLNASPQPCLIGFLKKSLPLLRRSLVTEELSIEGIRPPATHVAFSTVPSRPVMTTSAVQMHKPLMAKPSTSKQGISVLQNIPLTLPKVTKMSPKMTTPIPKNISSPKVRTIKRPSHFGDIHDDDINDVAAMGGVNLAEESQRILGSAELAGTQLRSIKDEYLISSGSMKSRVKNVAMRYGLDDPAADVAGILSHAVQMKLKDLIEKLAVITEHRTDLIKTDPRYEQTQDVKGQLKFLEEVERADRKKREETERELLLRAAKSRSKNEDPEQLKLKAKAKEMQRAEMEELRQKEANLTALQAIGPRKKPRVDGPMGGAGDSSTSNSTNARAQPPQRSRMKRVNFRDMIFLMEQEKETIRSLKLYRAYLK